MFILLIEQTIWQLFFVVMVFLNSIYRRSIVIFQMNLHFNWNSNLLAVTRQCSATFGLISFSLHWNWCQSHQERWQVNLSFSLQMVSPSLKNQRKNVIMLIQFPEQLLINALHGNFSINATVSTVILAILSKFCF